MTDGGPGLVQAGWREVLVVAGLVVGGVLALAVLTSILPVELQRLVFRTPLAIAVLVVGTLLVIGRLVRGGGSGQAR